jgi:polyisoprenoid-binding protein YceI
MKVNYTLLYTFIFSFWANWTYAQDAWKIDSTRIVFHISNAGLDVEGSMAGITGIVKFSQNKLDKSFFIAEAKTETIQTGIKLRDKHLKKPDYFDVEKYPTIKIESKKIMKSKNGFDSFCTLTLKGKTKDIVLPFTFNQMNKNGEFKGSFSLNRPDFGLGEKSIILSETVTVDIWMRAGLITD